MPGDPQLVIVPLSPTASESHFRFTRWELHDLAQALAFVIRSERFPEDEHERMVDLEKKVIDILRQAVLWNRDAAVEFREPVEIQ